MSLSCVWQLNSWAIARKNCDIVTEAVSGTGLNALPKYLGVFIDDYKQQKLATSALVCLSVITVLQKFQLKFKLHDCSVSPLSNFFMQIQHWK